MSIFEQASRLKLRFETTAGVYSVEDLWDLPLKSERKVSLDRLAQIIHKELGNVAPSFVDETTTGNKLLELKFEIVKHVIATVKAENAVESQRQAKKVAKQELLAILESKQKGALLNLSEEELLRKIEELSA